MKISILRRYDVNGASCPDFDVEMGEFTPDENSMWRVVEVVNIDGLQKEVERLKEREDELLESRGKFASISTERLEVIEKQRKELEELKVWVDIIDQLKAEAKEKDERIKELKCCHKEVTRQGDGFSYVVCGLCGIDL